MAVPHLNPSENMWNMLKKDIPARKLMHLRYMHRSVSGLGTGCLHIM